MKDKTMKFTQDAVTEDSPTHTIKSHRKEILFRNNTRLSELSKPKYSKSLWQTSFGVPLVWGNQDTMWPVSKAALKHVPSKRLAFLAKPKNDCREKGLFYEQYEFSCGRESSIWLMPQSTRSSPCTTRMNYLAQPKQISTGYVRQHLQNCSTSCGRSSPIWRLSKSALTCSDRPRTAHLARPKSSHPYYQPCRQVESIVKESAKQYAPTREIDALAKPKLRHDGPFREPQWDVSIGAKQAEATQRQVELARSKRLAEGYEPSKGVVWPVSVGAKHAVPSSRLSELSKPIVRDTMDHVQFNPEAFQVSPNATKAVASARVEELAQPIQR